MEFKYEIKGVTLDEFDMRCIKNYYEQRCTAEYLAENYNLDEERAMSLAADVRELMDDWEISETEAIYKILSDEGISDEED
jgi:hypothetical protein